MVTIETISPQINELHRRASALLQLKCEYEDTDAYDLIEQAQDKVDEALSLLREARAAAGV